MASGSYSVLLVHRAHAGPPMSNSYQSQGHNYASWYQTFSGPMFQLQGTRNVFFQKKDSLEPLEATFILQLQKNNSRPSTMAGPAPAG